MNSLPIVSDLLLLTVGITDLSCSCQCWHQAQSIEKNCRRLFHWRRYVQFTSHNLLPVAIESQTDRSCYETEDCIASQCLDREQLVSVVLAYCCDDRSEISFVEIRISSLRSAKSWPLSL